MVAPEPATRRRTFAEALTWSVLLALFAAGGAALLTTVVSRSTNAGILMLAAASAGVVGAVCGGVLGLLSERRARLIWMWTLPLLVLLGGGVFIYLTVWQQSDHGGLATAALAGVVLMVVLTVALAALIFTVVGRSRERLARWAFAGLGIAMSATALYRTSTAPSVEDEGWIAINPELPTRTPTPPAPQTQSRPVRSAPVTPSSPAPPRDPIVDADCRKETPPLYRALLAGDADRVKKLVDGDRTSANLRCDYGEGTYDFPLHRALVEGHALVAVALLEAGADPDLGAPRAPTPLALAVQARDEDLVRRLLAAGADVTSSVTAPRDAEDVPLILEAARSGGATIVRMLLEAGADPNANHRGESPLHAAAAGASVELVRSLVEAGADLDATNADGERSTEVAAEAGRAENLAVLLDAGAMDATAALRGALAGGHLELAAALVERGVDIENHYLACDVLALLAQQRDPELLERVLARTRRVRAVCVEEAETAALTTADANPELLRILRELDRR